MNYVPEDENRKKPAKALSYKEAKLKAAAFCAYQERYQQEVRDKLYSYGLPPTEVEDLLSYLISEGFINEERFAKSFAGGKFRIKKWGRTKIEYELARRKISSYCIGKGLDEIDEEDYREVIIQLIEDKAKSSNEENVYKLKSQIATYLVRKGFENSLVWDILNVKIST